MIRFASVMFVTGALAAAFLTGAGAQAAGPLPSALKASCPGAPPQALPSRALGAARTAALRQARTIYKSLDLTGARARAAFATHAGARGAFARKCGSRVEDRTVVVFLSFPAMKPSASLSQGVLLLARFSGGFRVWAVLH